MKFVYDWEFLEDGHTIEPISIGIVSETGEEYYAIVQDAPWSRIVHHRWLNEHVVYPFLPVAFAAGETPEFHESLPDFDAVKTRAQIAYEVSEFLTHGLGEDEEADLWGFFPAYDHVCLMQMYGSMVNRPEGLPMRTSCLMQHAVEMERRGESLSLPVQDPKTVHHALYDARHEFEMARSMGIF